MGGALQVTEVRPWNLVIEKYGRLVTVNKTKCIGVMPLCLKDRDLKGRAIECSPDYKALQEKMVTEKIEYLKKKMAKRESLPIGPVDQKEEAKEAKVQPKPMNIPPTRKVAYRADDLKVGDKLIVYLPTKKGSYLGEVRKIWLPRWKRHRKIRRSGSGSTYGAGLPRGHPHLHLGGLTVVNNVS